MFTSHLFSSFIRRAISVFLFLAIVLCVANRLPAQNSGTVAIYTLSIQVFSGQSVAGSSGGTWQCQSSPIPIACPTLPDHGFAAQTLFVCNNHFSGTIDLEWAPISPVTSASTFYPLVTGSYANDSGCHNLQLGGYYPNLRSTVTPTLGNSGSIVSATYNASATAIPYTPPALNSNGPTSPISCDSPTVTTAANGTTDYLSIGALRTADTVYLCNWTISFAGAPSAGTVSIGWATTSGCGTPVNNFTINTTSSTPQTLIFPGQNLRQSGQSQEACVTNNSGVSLVISANGASLVGL